MSSQPLRGYQQRAVDSVRAKWVEGARSVCLVAPTGAGKTRLGEELISDAIGCVWVAHRRELIIETAKRLRSRFGAREVGVIMPGEYETPKARIQVATTQTLISRDAYPAASHLVLDEAHHYAAVDWRRVADRYPNARTVGLTATPERGDGEPLGDLFGAMVVTASYSELIALGFLVAARVYRPSSALGNDLAQDPVAAWLQYSEGSLAFVFCARVEIAFAVAQRFRDAGVPAGTIEADTPKAERDDLLNRFRRGTIKVLTNVNTLTEGVDVPQARTVILARQFGHAGGYLQAAGRGLRPSDGKPDMILLDLTGTSIRHGLPTKDRYYSLDGRAISGVGAHGGGGEQPEFDQSVVGAALTMVAPGAFKRGDVVAEVKTEPVDENARRAEYVRLVGLAKSNRMRAGFAAAKYHDKFGDWPREEWIR